MLYNYQYAIKMTSEEIAARIAQIEFERDALLKTTECVRLGKRTTTHSVIKQDATKRINNLRKFGTEQIKQSQEHIAKRMQTMHARYDAGCNINAVKATKMSRYGHMFGDKDAIKQHKIERFGNAMGDIDKLIATKLKRYGSIYGKDSNAKAYKTIQERFGVPYFVMHPKCMEAANTISGINKHWHAIILRHLHIDMQLDAVRIQRYSYDLSYDIDDMHKLLVEINPTVSHNSTLGFRYATKLSNKNEPLDAQYHYNKTKLALDAGYRCITVFDWDSQEDVINLIADIIAGTEQLKITDTIEIDLSKESPLNYPDYAAIDFKINCHTCMLGKTEVDVYDCGHLTMMRSNTK